MNDAAGSGTEDPALPAYAGPVERRRFRRIKLGLFLSSMAACLSVTLLGLVCSSVLTLANGLTGGAPNFDTFGSNNFMSGVYMAFQLSTYNFFLFFITVPAAWLALGLSIGRLPYRGIVKRRAFLRWGIIWGAILVGGTTGGFGLIGGIASALGGVLAGTPIGAAAGAICGLLFYTIVKPANQLSDVDVSVF